MSNAAASKAIVRFGVNPPAVEEGKPGSPISGDPKTRLQNYFTDASGQFFSGIWESSPGKWPVRYSESEFCAILEGKCVLTDEAGRAETFGKGDSFVIPSGFAGTWETVEPVKKLYAIFEPKS
ncbi:cupin domain-containing protein [Dongia sedimenti]|uniref:Cupin domain-containing protein n=1 Tax=Dongia sedimenti TaxID=3064282 RepID=A0ABU0YUD4_9PROT|nr:cupin domain-containing protein [Rhodospirillaceae bacterium R-7]